MPTAATISVRETLDLLDGPFFETATAIEQRRYALWLGSGVSRNRVADLRDVIKRLLVHLWSRIDRGSANCRFRRALEEVLLFAQLSSDEQRGVDFAEPVDSWPSLDIVLQRLARDYSRILDVRIEGEARDYLLWDAVDVRGTFSSANPDCEHLCVAVLILEGVIPDIASANWDGLIEAATRELAGNNEVLRVCVRADDLREPPLRTRLLKFHGCAVRAGSDPAVYRELLVARQSQITDWPHEPAWAPVRLQLVNLAMMSPTLMIGLSAQDKNIQDVFAEARATMGWPWPCHPPAYVFCEEYLGPDQRNILRCVYQDAYDGSGAAIDAAALLPAFAKPLLVALVLHVLCAKLKALVTAVEAPGLTAPDRDALGRGLLKLRNLAASAAEPDRLVFVRALVRAWSRGLSIFQEGRSPSGDPTYRPVGSLPVNQIAGDPQLSPSGLREAAMALAVLGMGEDEGMWAVTAGDPGTATDGVLHVSAPGGDVARVFFAVNSGALLRMTVNGIVHDDDGDALVLHSDELVPRSVRSPKASPGRTGRPSARHISVRTLLSDVKDLDALRHRFREESAL